MQSFLDKVSLLLRDWRVWALWIVCIVGLLVLPIVIPKKTNNGGAPDPQESPIQVAAVTTPIEATEDPQIDSPGSTSERTPAPQATTDPTIPPTSAPLQTPEATPFVPTPTVEPTTTPPTESDPALTANGEEQESPSADASLIATDTTPTPVPIAPLPNDIEEQFTISKSPELKGQIAFATKIYGYQRIFVLDLQSRRLRKLISGPGGNSNPTWSPDGTLLAFTSTRYGTPQVFIADWDGGNHRQVTKGDSAKYHPSFSPDGKKVLFMAVSTGSSKEVSTNFYSVNIDGTGTKQLTNFKGRNYHPRWSPDGKSILYSTRRFWPGWDVCLFSLDRRTERCILTGRSDFTYPMWVRGGESILYSFGSETETDVGQYTLKTDVAKTLTSAPRRELDSEMGPLGKFIVFTAETEKKDNFNVMIYDIENDKTMPLVLSTYSIRGLSWTEKTSLELEAQRAKTLQSGAEGSIQ